MIIIVVSNPIPQGFQKQLLRLPRRNASCRRFWNCWSMVHIPSLCSIEAVVDNSRDKNRHVDDRTWALFMWRCDNGVANWSMLDDPLWTFQRITWLDIHGQIVAASHWWIFRQILQTKSLCPPGRNKMRLDAAHLCQMNLRV